METQDITERSHYRSLRINYEFNWFHKFQHASTTITSLAVPKWIQFFSGITFPQMT